MIRLRYRVNSTGWIYIGKHSKIDNPKRVYMGNAAQIAPYCLICPHGTSKITLNNNVIIGMFSRLTYVNEIFIGRNVIIGPNVFISDYNHAYQDVTKPISQQGCLNFDWKVIIDDDCWIGTNVVICGNVHIGKHVVIGAGSFVNKDIPDFCVAVGNPIRIVKKYNFNTNMWERCK